MQNESPPRLNVKETKRRKYSFQVRNIPSLNRVLSLPRVAESAALILRGLPRLSPFTVTSSIQTAPAVTGFCGAVQPSEPDAHACPRGCRLAVSWESRRVCTLVLEAVTLPCIAVLADRTSRVHLTSLAHPPTRLYIDIVAHRVHVYEYHSSRSSGYLLR